MPKRPLAPFEQLAFGEVPHRPVKPHGFFEAPSERIIVPTKPFGDVGIRVIRHGQGPSVVCIHGFMTTSYSFRYLLEPLGRTHSVVAFDLPGAGESDKPAGSYGPDALAEATGDVIGALGLRGAPVIGNSLGGYLAMRLAMRDPACVGRLVCLHAPGLPTPRMRALRVALDKVPRVDDVIRWLVARDEERWVHKNVHYFDESLKSREEHREYARPLRKREGVDAFIRMLDETLDVRQMVAFESQLRALGGAFPVPLQLVYARKDPMVPPSVGARMSKLLPSAQMVWLDDASHFAHVDNPDAFLAAALPFLEGR
ncbi:MAG: alpha/beta hydrolase [Polyangiaceae bacterium]|nr:alpha/beta hydrolase [Polyangiaceae bacterium]